MSSELHYHELERRLGNLEKRVDTLDRRNSELREEVIAARHEIEAVRDMLRAQDATAAAILKQVEMLSATQLGTERNLTAFFNGFDEKLKSIQAAIEAGKVGKPIPF